MRIFDPNRPFFRAVSRVADIAGISLLWVFLSLPVVTLGAASAAAYESARRFIRTGENGAFACFFSVFRSSFRATALPSLLWCAIGAALGCGLRLLALLALSGRQVALFQLAVSCVLLIVPAGVVCWFFPLCARLSAGFGEKTLCAVWLTFAHLPSTLAVIGLTVVSAVLCWRYWIPVVFLPSLCALASSFLMERVFAAEGIVPPVS